MIRCSILIFAMVAHSCTETQHPRKNEKNGANSTGNQSGTTSTQDASAETLQVFPSDNPWNQDISALPVHRDSTKWIASIGASVSMHADFGTTWQGAPNGIPYVIVSSTQPLVPVTFEYADGSDPGPYPIPADAPIEGGPAGKGDRHVIVIDRDQARLYELYAAKPQGNGWTAGSGAIFDLKSNTLRHWDGLRPTPQDFLFFPGLCVMMKSWSARRSNMH